MVQPISTTPPDHSAPGPRARGVARPHPAAFTLIELVAVIVILAVLSALAVPASLTFTSGRHAAAMRTVARDLAYARARAIASGSPVWVSFSVQHNAYSLLAENPAAPGFAGARALTDPASGSPMSVRLGTAELAGTSLLAASFAGSSALGFDRLGRPLATTGALLASDGVVTLSGSRQVTVLVPTGRIADNSGVAP